MTSTKSGRLATTIVLLCTAVVLVLVGTRERRRGPTGPNVVLIVVDTLRPDHLSAYGYARPTAAALDGFTAQATRFDEAYAAAPWTAPSTASLHTGLLPTRHGLDRFATKLGPGVTTLAEALHAQGWHTVAHSFNPHVSRVSGFGQGFDEFDDFLGSAIEYPNVSQMVDRVLAWLDTAPPEPFFLYLQPMNAHGPYRVPPADRAKLLGHPPSRDFVYYGDLMSAVVKDGHIERRREVTPAILQSLVDQYDTAIRYTTDQLGRILDRLRERGLYDDALIILTADHGEELFDHGGFSHGYSLHRELLRVPLLVKLPGQKAARTISRRVSLVDLHPSVLDLLGLPVSQGLDGVSFAPLLVPGRAPAGGQAEPSAPRPLLFEVNWPERCVARSILDGPYKLIERERNYEGRGRESLLFDVEQDPQERTNLAGRDPEIVRRLADELSSATALEMAHRLGYL